MITRIEALNYRCLEVHPQDLGPFHVLVGPNASGKTTFLDVVAFLGRLVTDGPEAAVVERTQNFEDLVWGRHGDRFELAIEAAIPDRPSNVPLEEDQYETVRYEVAIGLDPDGGGNLTSRREGSAEESARRSSADRHAIVPRRHNRLPTILTRGNQAGYRQDRHQESPGREDDLFTREGHKGLVSGFQARTRESRRSPIFRPTNRNSPLRPG